MKKLFNKFEEAVRQTHEDNIVYFRTKETSAVKALKKTSAAIILLSASAGSYFGYCAYDSLDKLAKAQNGELLAPSKMFMPIGADVDEQKFFDQQRARCKELFAQQNPQSCVEGAYVARHTANALSTAGPTAIMLLLGGFGLKMRRYAGNELNFRERRNEIEPK